MPGGFQFVVYVGGGTVGFLSMGALFFLFEPSIGLTLVLFGLVYFVGATVGFWLWNRLTFE